MPGTYTVVERAQRTMKARRYGRCPLCGFATTPGQQIGKIRAGWAHITCISRRD